MTGSGNPKLDKVYSAESESQQREAYDAWANDYDRDLFAFGFRLPAVAAAVFAAHVPSRGPILDAGCGTGLQAEPLALLGYAPLTGIDLSEGMLAAAKAKGIYAELRRMALGVALDFADDAFAACFCTGTLTPGHAPADSLDELIRVTRPGGRVVFSLRTDPGAAQASYLEAVAAHEAAGRWRRVFRTPDFLSMPLGDPDILGAVFVQEVA